MKTAKYYFWGIALACFVHLFAGCPKTDTTVVKINQGAQQAADAFTTGDTEQLKSVLTPTSQEQYQDILTDIQQDMKAYGAAFKNRTLQYYTENYAVYTFTENGKTYTAAFAHQDDGTWKLVRF